MSKIEMIIHPSDALLDEDYEIHTLQTEDYKPVLHADAKITDEQGRIEVHNDTWMYRFEAINDHVIRIRMGKTPLAGTVTQRLGLIRLPEAGMSAETEGNAAHLVLKTAVMQMDYRPGDNEWLLSDSRGTVFLKTTEGGSRFSEEPAEYSGIRSLPFFKKQQEEQFFGFGARIIHPNRTETTADIFSEKAGLHAGDYGGFPNPFFISTKGYGFFFNNPWPHVYFDMGKTFSDKWFVHASGGDYDVFVIKADSVAEIVRHYTEIVGRIQMPKRWELGFWCSSINFNQADDMIDYGKRMREQGYPCDVFVLDGSWRGGKSFSQMYLSHGVYRDGDFSWHETFGDGKKMVKELKNIGIKTCLHINSRSFSGDTINKNRHLLRQYMDETVPLLLDEKGEQFYAECLEPRAEDGVEVWWTDHSDRVSGELTTGIPSRNLFGAVWNRFLYEFMKKHGIDNHMALSRGGGIGSQRYALPWAGDTSFEMKRYKEDIWYVINAGMAGFALSGVDLGGFRSPDREASAEEMLRAEINEECVCRRICQSLIFMPVARIHNGHGVAKLPWNCPESTQKLYRQCLEFRYSLIPYLYSCAIEAHRTGAPLIRPLIFYHMDDKKVYNIGDQFYLGEALLVAPVVEQGAEAREVYLPEGEWMDFHTGVCHQGRKTIMVEAPLKEVKGLPMFVKLGSALVREYGKSFQTEDIPEILHIDFYPDRCGAKIQCSESNTVTELFACTFTSDGAELLLENNTGSKRKYCVRLIGLTVAETQVEVAANTVYRGKIQF